LETAEMSQKIDSLKSIILQN